MKENETAIAEEESVLIVSYKILIVFTTSLSSA